MLRDKIITDHKGAIAHLKAAADVATGAGVVIDPVTGTFAAPTAATAENIYFVQKAKYAEALKGRRYVSDWEPEFLTVKADEPAPLYNYAAGDIFATDQFAEGADALADGTYLQVGTDGKLTQSADPTKYRKLGLYDEVGNTLIGVLVGEAVAVIEVSA
jgi:hypothetical protein